MNCPRCETELIWGGDHDCEEYEEYLVVSNSSCPKCSTLVFVYIPREEEEELTPQEFE